MGADYIAEGCRNVASLITAVAEYKPENIIFINNLHFILLVQYLVTDYSKVIKWSVHYESANVEQ